MFVFVIGHIPPGSNDCFQVWSQNYYRIVNRYESTIAAQFFGHTHQDEFELFYDDTANDTAGGEFGSLRATNIAYVSPSATTFCGVNPGYRYVTCSLHISITLDCDRIYTLDAKSFEVLDHETYFANLTQANQYADRKPLWFQLGYSARDAYGLASLEPFEWHKLVLDMVHDEKLFQQFYLYYFNKSDYTKVKPCNDQICKADILCRLITGKAHDFSLCQKFLRDLDLAV